MIWGLFLTFLGWSVGLILPLISSFFLMISISLIALFMLFIFDIVIIIAIVRLEKNFTVASILLFLFGVSNGLISFIIVYVAIQVVPLYILISVFGVLAGFFLLELIFATLFKIERYPHIFILSILLIAFGLAIAQFFIPFFSLLSIIIDLVIVAIFGIVLFFDLQLIRQEPDRWACNTLNIFLDLLNIICLLYTSPSPRDRG